VRRLVNAPLPLAPARPGANGMAAKVADPFYASPEYRKWRTLVIERAGGICQAPSCGRRERRMFADHVIERRDGAADLDPGEWPMSLRRLPRRRGVSATPRGEGFDSPINRAALTHAAKTRAELLGWRFV